MFNATGTVWRQQFHHFTARPEEKKSEEVAAIVARLTGLLLACKTGSGEALPRPTS